MEIITIQGKKGLSDEVQAIKKALMKKNLITKEEIEQEKPKK